MPTLKLKICLAFCLISNSHLYSQSNCEYTYSAWKAFSAKSYQSAINDFEKAVSIYRMDKSNCLAESYYGLALSNWFIGNIKEAETSLKALIPIYPASLGFNNETYYSIIHLEGKALMALKKFSEAEPFFLKALVIQTQLNKKNIQETGNIFRSLAIINQEKNDLAKSQLYYTKALEIYRLLKDNREDIVPTLKGFADVLVQSKEYSKAEAVYAEMLHLPRSISVEDQQLYSTTLNNLAVIYVKSGQYKKAEKTYLESLEVSKSSFGKLHPNYAISLNNIADFYKLMGEYDKALHYALSTVDTWESISGKRTIDYASAIDNLASIYVETGTYDKAEQYYFEALDLRKTLLGEENLLYAETLNNLSVLFANTYNYEKSETFLIKSFEIKKKLIGEMHPSNITVLINLGSLYANKKDYMKAETYFLKANSLIESAFRPNHPEYVTQLRNLAAFFLRINKFTRAQETLEKILETQKNAYGERTTNYALILNDLSYVYLCMHKFSDAEQCFNYSNYLIKTLLGIEHPAYLRSLNIGAHLYVQTGRDSLAAINYLFLLSTSQKTIKNYSLYFPKNTLSGYLDDNAKINNEWNSWLYRNKGTNISYRSATYNQTLFYKGFLSTNEALIKTRIYASNDSSVIGLYEKLKSLNDTLLTYYLHSTTVINKETERIRQQIQQYESLLVKKSSAFTAAQALNTNWQNVQSSLEESEAAIEFFSFPYYNRDHWTDSVLYVASLIRKGDNAPTYIKLFEERQLLNFLVHNKAEADSDYIKRIYNGTSTKPIEELIWKPLAKSLDGVKKIYYTNTGLLHTLNFNALPIGQAFELRNLNSTADLDIVKKDDQALQNIKQCVVFGGIDYDKSSEESVLLPTIVKHDAAPTSSSPNYTPYWNYLPNSLREVSEIKKLCNERGIVTKEFTGKQASEAAFKTINHTTPPFILHFATHGYFYNYTEQKSDTILAPKLSLKEKIRLSADPLLRSGLLLSGANKTWDNYYKKEDSKNDGILTALEISNLDLSTCHLVTLSACNTGLGEISGSEGVLGLERAFKQAGSKKIITALWSVPDGQTMELMKLFYFNLFKGMSVSTSLKSAQSALKEKYSAYFWAAFKLLE